ncbi:MAG: dipeptidase [Bacteroidales bacterium]|nr:dipeptidase [Bacteroidales bacterium]
MRTSFVILLTGWLLCSCSENLKTPEQLASEIHEKALTVDSHTDTPWALLRGGYDLNQRYDARHDRLQVDFPRMKEGGLDAVFMAAFVAQGPRDEDGNERAVARISQSIDSIQSHLSERSGTAMPGLTPGDAYRFEKEGKRTVFIGIENGYGIGNDLSNIEKFYKNGARYITLCHTLNNDICDSSTDTTEHKGLSPFGEKVVIEMNRVGMMIDVSHISDSSFYDVIQLTSVPVIASHSCARALCDNPRNLTDDMLKTLAGNGGVIQMCILSDYVKTPEPFPQRDSARQAVREKFNGFEGLTEEQMEMARKEWYAIDSIFPRRLATVSDMVNHIDHIVQVAGIDHVGIGTDFDGGGGLKDCNDVSRMGNITLELVRRGYTEEQITKIWGGNIMRVMGEVQDYAQKALMKK